MTVTVVIPVRDRVHLIGRCLDSVAAQTRRPDRVVVVDNSSTDGTPGAVRRWSEAHADLPLTLLEEKRPGASAARNRGLDAVDTDLVYFFDSDDEMLPDLLEKAIEAIGDAELVYWKAEIITLSGQRRSKAFYTDSLLRRQFYNSVLSTQAFLARTELVRRVGGWNEQAAVWNDWELGLRIAMARPRRAVVPEVLVRIHAQEKSITGTAFSRRRGDWERTLAIVEEDIMQSPAPVADKRRMLDMLAYRRVVLAAAYRREGDCDAAASLLVDALRAPHGTLSAPQPTLSAPKPTLSARKRWLLRFIYHYTALGGRAAYLLWR